jgi:hypothetical protein
MSIAQDVRLNLLAIVEAYCRATGQSESAASRKFYGNNDFFAQLRAGEHSISVQRLDKMLGEFRRKWPRNADWPFTRAIFMGQRPLRP